MQHKLSSGHIGQRLGLWGIALAAFLSLQTGCESNGLYGGFQNPGPSQQASAEPVTSAGDAELEEAALLRVQELLAEEGPQPGGTTGGVAARDSQPMRLSSVFSALSTQARRFGGRFVVP
jgi:hypothetical protein